VDRYLVTGGAGFIGSNTVDELVRRGHNVWCSTICRVERWRTFLPRMEGRTSAARVTDLDHMHEACRGVDYVLHLVHGPSVPRSVLNLSKPTTSMWTEH